MCSIFQQSSLLDMKKILMEKFHIKFLKSDQFSNCFIFIGGFCDPCSSPTLTNVDRSSVNGSCVGGLSDKGICSKCS